MAEAYGGGLLGRAEQFFDAIPGGMRGPQAPVVRMVVGAIAGYALVTATAPLNSYMYYEDGTPKPASWSQEGINSGPENSVFFPYWTVPAALGVACGTLV